MQSATKARPPASPAPHIGAGVLHNALEAAAASAKLEAFTRSTGCAPAEVSSDGKSLNVEMVLKAMRARGYTVSVPMKAQQQLKRGYTTWVVKVGLPRCSATLAFLTPGEKP